MWHRDTLDQVNRPSSLSEVVNDHDDMQSTKVEGVVLDAAREVRVKFYVGQVCDPTTSTFYFH
jgi:hypothetical protein